MEGDNPDTAADTGVDTSAETDEGVTVGDVPLPAFTTAASVSYLIVNADVSEPLASTVPLNVADVDVTDVGRAADPAAVSMPVGFPSVIAGVDYPEAEVVRILEEIGCEVAANGSVLTVAPPSWRPDLRNGPDLTEEVARIHGFDAIPSVVPTPPGGRGLTHGQRIRRVLADVLAAQGLTEIWSAPFVSDEVAVEISVEAMKAE